jgi:SAM-dependent methyltransferase
VRVQDLFARSVEVLRPFDRALFGAPFERLHRAIEREIGADCKSLLDLGCGTRSPIWSFERRLTRSIGVDLDFSSLVASRRHAIHDGYVCADIRDLEFLGGSFDCAIALDVIEHLTKQDGSRVLAALERLSGKVIVFTPSGFLPQGAVGGKEEQRHLSGWSAAEMRRLGYRVLGMSGWKPLRGEEARPTLRPHFLWDRVARWTEPMVESRPELAFQLLCVKDLRVTC